MEPEPTAADSAENTARSDSAATRRVKKGGPLSGGLGLFVSVVMLGTAIFLTYRTLFTSEPSVPMPLVFMCVETNKTFTHAMEQGEQWPVVSPYTNKNTGYPTEQCYWTKDGRRKRTPTYVVLNSNLGKPGDTFCPDCDRLVVGHNPLPPPGTPWADETDSPALPSTAPVAPHP